MTIDDTPEQDDATRGAGEATLPEELPPVEEAGPQADEATASEDGANSEPTAEEVVPPQERLGDEAEAETTAAGDDQGEPGQDVQTATASEDAAAEPAEEAAADSGDLAAALESPSAETELDEMDPAAEPEREDPAPEPGEPDAGPESGGEPEEPTDPQPAATAEDEERETIDLPEPESVEIPEAEAGADEPLELPDAEEISVRREALENEAPAPVEPEAAEVEEGLRPAPIEGEVDRVSAAEEDGQVAPATVEVETPAAAAEAAPAPEDDGAGDPFAGPGDWYVIHTYAGYENKVKANLASRVKSMQMQDRIFDVVIPMEDVMEIKGGKKQVVQKKVFPGYLVVKMVYDDDSWICVRNTPGVTGFVSSGTGQKPTPLSRREVEKILTVKEEDTKKPALRLEFEEGDVVRIISGPFADFNGTIADINPDQSKVRVMVNIFDRETPVELSFDQVAKV